MTKKTIDYRNAVIYKICCKDPLIKDVYVGSTTNFRMRKYQHKFDCINEYRTQYNMEVYKHIRKNGGINNWDMILIEEMKECENGLQLHKRERFYLELLNANLNTQIPSRNKNQWYQDNKENKSEKAKIYYKENRERIIKRSKEYYNNKKLYNING